MNADRGYMGRRTRVAAARGKEIDLVSVQVIEPTQWSEVTSSSGSGIKAHHEQPQNDDLVITASIKMNLLLLIGKVAACVMILSPVIVASLIDSAVDVLVQVALFWANKVARREVNAEVASMYPAGRGQLEPVSIVVCAALKCAGMIAVAVEALGDLYAGDPQHGRDKHGLQHIWRRHFEAVCTLALLSVTKFFFCIWCELVVRGRRGTSTETMRAVLADNQNDVTLSAGALVALVVTQLSSSLWWVDAAAALLLAAFIVVRWATQGREQVELIIGRAADPRFLEMVRDIAETHDPSTMLDVVRAYHFGPRFLVELEMIMDEHTELRESHDCGILLQHKIEALPQVERCFVHIDYQPREVDDHDLRTPVARKVHTSHELRASEEHTDSKGASALLSATSLTSLLAFDEERQPT